MKNLLLLSLLMFVIVTCSHAQGKPEGGVLGNPVAKNQPPAHYVLIQEVDFPDFTARLVKVGDRKDSVYMLYTFTEQKSSAGETIEVPKFSCSLGKVVTDPVFYSVNRQNFLSFANERGMVKPLEIK